jgi:hypothetical protein
MRMIPSKNMVSEGLMIIVASFSKRKRISHRDAPSDNARMKKQGVSQNPSEVDLFVETIATKPEPDLSSRTPKGTEPSAPFLFHLRRIPCVVAQG